MIKKSLILIFCLALVFSVTGITKAAELKERLKGYILLQVESKGEAWYVNPNDGNRYYMKNGIAAYQIMRDFGLGITNADLKKIPVGIDFRFNDSNPQTDQDGDGLSDKLEEALGTPIDNNNADQDEHDDGREVLNGYDPLSKSTVKLPIDVSLVNRLKGKILIQVENKGQAWYLNPVDGKRYFLGTPDLAYQIMRYLSLGITNADLARIQIAAWKPVITYPSARSTISGANIMITGATQPNHYVWAYNNPDSCITKDHMAVGAARANENGNFTITVGVSQTVQGEWRAQVASFPTSDMSSGCFSNSQLSEVVEFTYSN